MASNALAASDPRFLPQFSSGNMLNPSGQFSGTQPVAPQDPFAGYAVPQTGLPVWLTDPTARGLGTDWSPAAHQDVAEQVFTPRVIPPDAPAPAPLAQAAAAPAPDALAQAAPSPFSQNNSGGGESSGAESADAGGAGADQGAGAEGDGEGAGDASDGGAAAGGDASGNSGGDASDGGGDAGGGDAGGGDSGGGGGDGDAKGGIITRNKLTGPNPPGPDDGYGKLKLGEGVLTAQAMKHYGPGIVAKLNKLVVPKEALAGKVADDEDDETRADDEDDEKPAAKKARGTDDKRVNALKARDRA